MSVQEWDSLVWWEAELLTEGLIEEHKPPKEQGKTGSGGGGIDLTDPTSGPSGFNTRTV